MVQDTLDLDKLNSLLSKGKHDTGEVLDVLPFLSKRTKKIKGQFNKVLGEYIRNICEVKLDEKSLKRDDFYASQVENELSEHIASSVEFKNEDDKYDFIRFIDQFLFNQDEIKPIHPFLFNFIKIDSNLSNEFGKYSNFMNDVLVRDNLEIKNIFKSKETDDILTELILNKMDVLKEIKLEKKGQYQALFEPLSSLYQEDLIYLSQYKDYFLTSFPLLTQYFVFMYACQLIVKFERFSESDLDEVHPLYFTLEWESVSKRRMAADELEGFRYIKKNATNLFPHIHTISHLNHNSLNPTNSDGHRAFIPYYELQQLIQENGSEYEKDYLTELKKWIVMYSKLKNIEPKKEPEDLSAAFKMLFDCIQKGMSSEVIEKYGRNLEDLGSSQFIKSRGSTGQVLNIKHDFLLLLTAVSVKNKRIPLNDLFLEFRKRGIALDRYSKKEIITLLDKLNILDKKSDSGDAHYVKPIL
ncbi:DNA phosphorothioation-dependent restriction protein DptG [Paenisporosarcina sp. NPDC076898]|uniref:DNA phosphorothioation-dependent restriction protein DptG n=1 Tax=unclassified Paenisporosarcina TaxID=2642018 RepID=UPI003D031CDD